MLAALALAGLAQAAAPVSVKATYQLFRDKLLLGEANETYVRDGNKYSIESVASPTGVAALLLKEQFRLASRGLVDAQGLKPLRFEYQRGAEGKTKTQAADFDWDAGVVTLTSGDKREQRPLPPRTQDRLSILYQFMFKPPRGNQVTLPMTNGRRLQTYRYLRKGEERVETPAGSFRTVHYVRDAKQGETRAELWLAKDRHHFPVRLIVQEDGGAIVEQRLIAVRFQ